uniref:Uncharacterized protein n=1 Tax=Sphaerodactylus townsendi TaxID=933632 RepID=A0ACB8F0G8_9SAUR
MWTEFALKETMSTGGVEDDIPQGERKTVTDFCYLLDKSKQLFNGLRCAPYPPGLWPPPEGLREMLLHPLAALEVTPRLPAQPACPALTQVPYLKPPCPDCICSGSLFASRLCPGLGFSPVGREGIGLQAAAAQMRHVEGKPKREGQGILESTCLTSWKGLPGL